MSRLTVYIIMASILIVNVTIFGFIFTKQSQALPSGVQEANLDTSDKSVDKVLQGNFDNPLKKPMDVAVTDEFIYITDTDSHKVHVFNLDGEQIFDFGERGREPGQMLFPYGVDYDEVTERLYVADLYTGKISMFSKQGEFIDYFAANYSNNGTIDGPGGLRINDGKLYLTDINNNQVLVFDLDGDLLLSFGEEGNEVGDLLVPNAIAIDKDGNIFVTDTGNNRVQVFDENGEFIRVINGSTDGAGQSVFVNPRGLAIDSSNRLFVVNNLTHTVHAFDLEGNRLFTLGSMGQGQNQLFLPNGLYIDQKNNVFVTDTFNQRVVMY